MKRVFALLFLLLVTTFAAAASNEPFTGEGGTLSGSNAGLTLSGQILGFDNGVVGNLGTVTLSTADFLSGNVAQGGTIEPGGMFTITGNGTMGVFNGVIFNGKFDDLKWTLGKTVNGLDFYMLTGDFTGVFDTGQKALGSFVILTEPGSSPFSGSVKVVSTDIALQVAPVPEPSSLVLLSTGVLGLIGIRHKLR